MKPIKIGAFDFNISFDKHIIHENLYGKCDFWKNHITLSPKLKDNPQVNIAETLLHEVVHAIDYVYNNRTLKESAIEQMSKGLLQVLRDNPEFVKIIIGRSIRKR